jgi:hypothetical protein
MVPARTLGVASCVACWVLRSFHIACLKEVCCKKCVASCTLHATAQRTWDEEELRWDEEEAAARIEHDGIAQNEHLE